MQPDWQTLREALAAECGCELRDTAPVSVGGGDISAAYRLETSTGSAFAKLQTAENSALFTTEAAGLGLLAAAGAVRVPVVLGTAVTRRASILLLEWVEPGGERAGTQAQLGASLAQLHAVQAPRYGLDHDNFIGSTPQINTFNDDWVAFFAQCRLAPQLDLCARAGYADELLAAGRELLDCLDELLPARPDCGLVHGDLWGGNWFSDTSGAPVIFDPAVYYGDPETDLAMTELFGGFGGEFYRAYRARRPEPADGARRRDVYRLYHVLNHANLFGGGYVAQALSLLRKVLS